MAWRKSKKSSPWGSKAKKADDAGSALSVLQRKLAKIKKAAPPNPDEALLDWMGLAYGEYCGLDEGEREELRARAKAKGKKMRTGNMVLLQFMDETAAGHVGHRQKKKYCRIFERAVAKDLHHWKLRKFIKAYGTITNCASGTIPKAPERKGGKAKGGKPKGPSRRV
ncbi:MAG: hypothetical protein WCG92_23345 [Hyphomicrobiales bacterium]